MGSLTSRPKLPPPSQPVIMQAPVSVARSGGGQTDTPSPSQASGSDNPNTTGGGSSSGQDDRDAQDSEEKQAESRSLGLLGRSRGRLSTVVTGFRGVLSKNKNPTGRKTLLGE